MKYTIVGIGEVLWDIYGSEKYLGGAPANFAFHAHQLGNEGIIVSKIGKDELGNEIIRSLKEKGLNTNFIQLDRNYPTGTVYVKLLPNSIPKFLCSKNVAFDYIEFGENLESLSETTDAVLFGTLAQRNEFSRKTITDFIKSLKKAIVVYDANFRGFKKKQIKIVENSLSLSNILKVNDIEFKKLKIAFDKEKMEHLKFLNQLVNEFDLDLICITFGRWGCLFYNKYETIYSPGVKINPIDTVGSGDAFIASLITKYLQKRPLKEISEFSNYVGAFVATKKGATPIYNNNDINNFIHTNTKRNIKKKLGNTLLNNLYLFTVI